MPFLRLDELPELFDGCPGWSATRPSLAWFRRADFLGDPAVPLDEAVRNKVEAETGSRPLGPVFLLANLRYFGVLTNPISCYYCFAPDGETLEYLVAEVTNTPWHERHAYVLPVTSGQEWFETQFDKALHVSPFNPMAMRYQWRSNVPGDRLGIHLENYSGDDRIFDATLTLEAQPLTAPNLAKHLLRYPLMTTKVVCAIYWQALRLWLKGNRFHSHPKLQTASIDHE
jgi:DUF1365 family protein